MTGGGLEADAELGGDGSCGHSIGQEAEHLSFARSQDILYRLAGNHSLSLLLTAIGIIDAVDLRFSFVSMMT